jgi:hypothetical protein
VELISNDIDNFVQQSGANGLMTSVHSTWGQKVTSKNHTLPGPIFAAEDACSNAK